MGSWRLISSQDSESNFHSSLTMSAILDKHLSFMVGGAKWTHQPFLPMVLFTLAITYLFTVAALRNRNLNTLLTKYATYLPNPHSMPYTTAKEVINTTMSLEFPFMFGFSLQWALIKSYGIATGTEILVKTRRLTDERMVGKRSEDTGLFLYELLVTGIDTTRGRTALAKMNWIHARYGSAISNGDLIHTLGLFVLEPIRYIERFEWRPMSELEKVALFVYWKEIGNRMGMTDIPQTLPELEAWMVEYEKTHMVYSLNNTKCYDGTLGLYLRSMPRWARGMAKSMADSLLVEDHVREALGVEDSPAWARWLVPTLFRMHAVFVRYCLLPRFHARPLVTTSPETGHLQRDLYLFEPWYVRETMWSKLQRWLGSSERSLAPGPEFLSEGYLPEELGPKEFRTAGKEDVRKQAALLEEYAAQGGAVGAGCPFAWAR